MDARDLLTGILAVVAAVLFLAFPHIFDLPLVRRLTKRLETWLGIEPSDGRLFSAPGTRRWGAWLDFEPHGSRVFSPPGTVGTVGSLAGFVIEPGRGIGPVALFDEGSVTIEMEAERGG